MGQQEHWLQWLDRVMTRINETHPFGDEVINSLAPTFLFNELCLMPQIPDVVATDLRLNLYALYAGCYMAVDHNETALQWAVK